MSKTALIIDDEEEICLLLMSYLRKKNVKSHYALSLNEGLEKCEKYKPDLIFLDNNLPDGSGISSISKFHKINTNTKIIIISAMTTMEDKAIESGAIAMIGKPISFQSIDRYLVSSKN